MRKSNKIKRSRSNFRCAAARRARCARGSGTNASSYPFAQVLSSKVTLLESRLTSLAEPTAAAPAAAAPLAASAPAADTADTPGAVSLSAVALLEEVNTQLAALQTAVEGSASATSTKAAPARPKTAMYRMLRAEDSGSVVSWSADAFGRSKHPGW